MAMYKTSSILNYFKPFTQSPRLNKRSLPENNLEEPRAVRRSRSSTPNDSQTEQDMSREEKPLGRRPPTISPRVTLGSSSTQPSGDQGEEPRDDATSIQVFREQTTFVAPVPVPYDTISRNADVLGSQSTSLTSSQRVVRKGEIVITNSDDESDSASSLEDLNDLLLLEGRGPRGEPSQPDPQIPASPLNGKAEDGRRMSTRRRTRSDQTTVPPPSALPVQSRKYKFDLELLAKQRKREEASIGDVAEAKAMVNSFEQQKASAGGNAGAASTKRPFDATFIDVVMKEHQDEDEISRLKAAIRRTEALHHGKSWSFFEEQAESLFKQSDFPTIEDDHLGRILRETSSRQQAFLNGYVGELAKKGNLPEEVLLWILQAMCLESRDDLRYSYTITLTDASQHLASILSPQRIDILFRTMGATAAALKIEGPVTPRAALSQNFESASRPALLSFLRLFKDSASELCTESRIHLICTLCRLVLDHSIVNSCHIMGAIEGAFESLIESIPEQNLIYEVGDEERQE